MSSRVWTSFKPAAYLEKLMPLCCQVAGVRIQLAPLCERHGRQQQPHAVPLAGQPAQLPGHRRNISRLPVEAALVLLPAALTAQCAPAMRAAQYCPTSGDVI